jgi:hypothetical protein
VRDTDGRQGIVEWRGTKKDGTVGLQSQIAGLHKTGEDVCLHVGDLTHDDTAPRRVLLFAIACILLRRLGDRRFKHDVRLATAGFLLKECGLEPVEVVEIGEAIAEQTGNDVRDVRTTVETTDA